jgi:hypothetical protein
VAAAAAGTGARQRPHTLHFKQPLPRVPATRPRTKKNRLRVVAGNAMSVSSAASRPLRLSAHQDDAVGWREPHRLRPGMDLMRKQGGERMDAHRPDGRGSAQTEPHEKVCARKAHSSVSEHRDHRVKDPFKAPLVDPNPSSRVSTARRPPRPGFRTDSGGQSRGSAATRGKSPPNAHSPRGKAARSSDLWVRSCTTKSAAGFRGRVVGEVPRQGPFFDHLFLDEFFEQFLKNCPGKERLPQ